MAFESMLYQLEPFLYALFVIKYVVVFSKVVIFKK